MMGRSQGASEAREGYMDWDKPAVPNVPDVPDVGLALSGTQLTAKSESIYKKQNS